MNTKQITGAFFCLAIIAGSIYLFTRTSEPIDFMNGTSIDVLAIIEIMELQDLKIYGTYGCSWCVKQLEEFGEYQQLLIDKGLFVDCDQPENSKECSNVISTPTWKLRGEIVKTGYIPLNELIGE